MVDKEEYFLFAVKSQTERCVLLRCATQEEALDRAASIAEKLYRSNASGWSHLAIYDLQFPSSGMCPLDVIFPWSRDPTERMKR